MATLDRIRRVASQVVAAHQLGHSLVVVVSAMQGETDRLNGAAYELSSTPNLKELDRLLSTGEQVSAALLAIAIQAQGGLACAFSAAQLPIQTDDSHTEARIIDIGTAPILEALGSGMIVVVTGFQGVTLKGAITTLGRGGSDLTAVALAVALKADECQIFKDVAGIYAADPKVVPGASKYARIFWKEVLELTAAGAKVLQQSSVELAGRHQVPLRVLPTFEEGEGTLLTY